MTDSPPDARSDGRVDREPDNDAPDNDGPGNDAPDNDEPGDDASNEIELLHPDTSEVDDRPMGDGAMVTSPAKVMRIGSMVRQLLEEVRAAPLDEASRERLAEVYERSVTELADALSDDLQEELRSLTLPFADDQPPSESELRVAQAQLVGWLEGLFHGIQATLFAQQAAARQQIEQLRQLPQPAGPGGDPQPGGGGVYL